MELKVQLETLAVAGEPVVISGFICGTLQPPDRRSLLVTSFGHKRVLLRMLEGTENFLLDYANLGRKVKTPRYEKTLCSVIAKYGILDYGWAKPGGLPYRCSGHWENTEKNGQIPFVLSIAEISLQAKKTASYLSLAKAISDCDIPKIRDLQKRLRFNDCLEEAPRDFGLALFGDRITYMLADAIGEGHRRLLHLGRREDGGFIMTITPSSLKAALLFAFCDRLGGTQRKCATCGDWFLPRGSNQVHCKKQCRTRLSVYRLRAVEAVKNGMSVEDAAVRYHLRGSDFEMLSKNWTPAGKRPGKVNRSSPRRADAGTPTQG